MSNDGGTQAECKAHIGNRLERRAGHRKDLSIHE